MYVLTLNILHIYRHGIILQIVWSHYVLHLAVNLLYRMSDITVASINKNNDNTVLSMDGVATEAPTLCNISIFNDNISIFVESFELLDGSVDVQHIFSNFEENMPRTCPLPNNGKCTVQHSNSNADVVFRVVRHTSPSNPERYWPGQILAVLNLEADRSASGRFTYAMNQFKNADIRIDHHSSSDSVYAELCYYMPIDEWQKGESPDPKERKGIALFSSDCNVVLEGFPERNQYYEKLMKLVRIDSYGKCWHNMPAIPASKNNWIEVFVNISRNYHMVLSSENIIEPDYITEKLPLIYRSGAIPVYRVPLEVYLWVPGTIPSLMLTNLLLKT